LIAAGGNGWVSWNFFMSFISHCCFYFFLHTSSFKLIWKHIVQIYKYKNKATTLILIVI
jgi:hypothetical protein